VQGRIPLFERAALTAEIERRTGATPFARFGSAPALALAGLMALTALLVGRGRRRGVH